jgi:conjugative relaxase-like TrwC/TraI family protein
MLSITKVKSTAKTTQYFAKDDYYASNDPNHQKFSNWYGEGAKELGLEGSVVAEEFRNVLDGKLSNGQIIGVQKGLNVIHDPGRDLTFSAPKSVSIMALVYEDQRLIEAHGQAVKYALDEIEKNYFKTRFKKNGEITLEGTGKMVVAMFKHELSRDLDPQLHTHAIVANVTVDDKGKWRSAFFDEIYDNKKFLGLIYRSELAKLVKDLGYEIEHKGKECIFEIKGVPKNLIDLFSNRSKTIRALADENSTQKELEKITVRSRQNKSVNEYEHNLSGDWKLKAKELLPSFNRQADSLIKSSSDDLQKNYSQPQSDSKNLEETKNLSYQAVEFAVKHLSERKTVFSRNEIVSVALNDTLSKSTPSEIIKAVDVFTKQKTLLPVRRAGLEKNTYTTAALLEKENRIIQLMIDGKDKHQAIVSDLSKYSGKFTKLNDGQKRSAELILATKDMVTGIQGFAGTGKTTMIKTINEILREEGQKILGLSPTGVATRNLSTVGNIESMTLQRFLLQYDGVANGRGTKEGRIEMKQKFEATIVLVDESSMISTGQMKDLLTISGELKFKLILVGDRRQLDSVEAGVPFYEMLRNGMPFTDMREILRQENDNLKAAVYSVIKRDIGKAFKELEGSVIEAEDVAHASVEQFMAKSPDHRKDTIVLTPANETRERVNKEISKFLYAERVKEERSKEYSHEIYKNKNLSEADKTRAYRFRAGDVVHFSKDRDFIGVKRNAYCEVTKIDTQENLITIKTGLLSTETFNPIKLKGKAEKNYFEVFEKEHRVFYEGDKVAFNRSIPELGIVNSDNAVLTKVGLLNFHLKLGSGKGIKISKKSPEAKLLDHAYAVTAHKAQGLTRKYVIAACESYRDELTTQKNFYVEISRAEQEAIIVTDSKQKIIEKLKENTGIEISAREHQGVDALGINMVGSSVKKKVANNLKSQAEKSHDESAHTESKKAYIHDYHPHEIREHFLSAIKSGITIEAKDTEIAISKALENKSEKIRFGQKKEYEVCWHGEAGYVKNYKTGEYFDWGLNSIKERRKVVEVSKEDLARKEAKDKANRAEKEKEKIAEEKAVAAKAKKYFEGFFKASSINTAKNKYLQRKGIDQKVIDGVRFTKDEKLVVPVKDAKGEIHSLQFISDDGSKIFLKKGKKMGCFFMIDADKVKDAKEIYLAEGFATGVSVHMATNKPVAITFDAGNIEPVLKNLKETHPNKEFTIAADNDLWAKQNVGREKAELAAQKYGVKVIVPSFSLAHKDELPTDFNDLHKLSGIHEVQRQIESHQIIHEHHHDLQI